MQDNQLCWTSCDWTLGSEESMSWYNKLHFKSLPLDEKSTYNWLICWRTGSGRVGNLTWRAWPCVATRQPYLKSLALCSDCSVWIIKVSGRVVFKFYAAVELSSLISNSTRELHCCLAASGADSRLHVTVCLFGCRHTFSNCCSSYSFLSSCHKTWHTWFMCQYGEKCGTDFRNWFLKLCGIFFFNFKLDLVSGTSTAELFRPRGLPRVF